MKHDMSKLLGVQLEGAWLAERDEAVWLAPRCSGDLPAQVQVIQRLNWPESSFQLLVVSVNKRPELVKIFVEMSWILGMFLQHFFRKSLG